jgi:hypothetical protein
MHPSSSPCDQPETSVLRLRLMDAILRADTTLLVRLAGALQEAGLVQTPPRHPCHQWERKLTGSSRGKSPLGTRHFLPYTRPMSYML